ncbi:sensor domain-containing diguanylate cyclase [Undibacterium sp. LX40W]|uniref:diguanylate cyclase n=1 Tax=Undibacterium nitidum TaxID=2762298 RepID=A0A923HMM5_9BURK|nr:MULTISPECIES: sensor domain-containing diguanylate cyclase [Undibacterium]MBC3882415.1 sensor domain-containing diguanylate cyclase [Undibacterium nitidum]MBC3892696.1 sensor domain-containing diguanylate cyclase [Undibacterium sp. LX40W]
MDKLHTTQTGPVGTRSNPVENELQLVRAQLNDLIAEARQNQEILQRHQTLDLQLIGSQSFRELIRHIFITLAEICELDQVTLCLLNSQHNLKEMLADLKIDNDEFPYLLFSESETELRHGSRPLRKPLVGPYESKEHQRWFEPYPDQPNSVAIIPLIRQSKLLGCLNLGSDHPDRFAIDMGTDFIERLGSIIAICLENVINSERLTQIGLTDALTNVSNRRYVEQRMLEEIGRARRQHYGISCMYLDIDYFKKINDIHGHPGGDEVLKETAKRIKAELRLSDTLGRFGGEEFVVLLVNTNHEDAKYVAERIRKSIANQAFLLTMTGLCDVTLSIGIATLSDDHNSGEIEEAAKALLQRADEALYEAKEQGRNRVIDSPED